MSSKDSAENLVDDDGNESEREERKAVEFQGKLEAAIRHDTDANTFIC